MIVYACMRAVGDGFEYVQTVTDNGTLITTNKKADAQLFDNPEAANQYCDILTKGGFENFTIEPVADFETPTIN